MIIALHVFDVFFALGKFHLNFEAAALFTYGKCLPW